jgi:nucleotide-binding universal stress UspA family protein
VAIAGTGRVGTRERTGAAIGVIYVPSGRLRVQEIPRGSGRGQPNGSEVKTMLQTDSQVWFQRIFHPSDFSDASNIAFVHALKLAVLANGRLTILHAGAEDGRQEFPGVRRTLERWEMLPPGSPEEAIFSVGLDVRKIATPHSDPARAVLHYLGEHPHDLIVLTTHQRDGFDRWMHKQVAEPIARRSGEMTLFIPHGSEGFVSLESGAVSLRNILIPVDHLPDPQIAVDGAVSFAHALECHKLTFTLLQVGEENRFPEVVMSERERWRWRKIYKQGNVEREILQAADECRADLIVMTTRGHHGFLGALRGNTTERIVRNSTCPVLALPAYGAYQSRPPESPVWRPAV